MNDLAFQACMKSRIVEYRHNGHSAAFKVISYIGGTWMKYGESPITEAT